MEDQPTGSSGVSPEVPAKPRRAHRMPVGKLRRGTVDEPAVPSAGAPEPSATTGKTPESVLPDVAAAPAEAEATETVPAEVDSATGDPDTDSDTEGADAIADPETGEAVTDPETLTPTEFAPRKPVGKWLKVAVAATALLFVAAAGFAGATAQPYLADRAMVTIKQDVASTAANAITTLWTYTPEDMEKLPDRASRYLSGGFEDAYRQYVDGIAAANKQAQITNDTQVLGAAVESISPSTASAIVYTNSTATSPLTKGIPSLRYVSYRLNMERHDAHWLVTKMSTITSLDLTPQV